MDDLALIEAELDHLLSEQDTEPLRDYISRHSPHFGPPAWTSILCELFERARIRPVRACISVPPRHGKTYTTLHALAKWVSESPADTSAYFTYNADRARSKSRLCRDLARRSGAKLAADMGNLSEWRTTEGGGLIAGGVASGVTGEGVSGLFVVDDSLKDRQEAESPLRRNLIWDWFAGSVFTRLEGASVIVVGTRWHQDDLIGRLESMGGWEMISLPATAEEGDALGREIGEALDPVRFPLRAEDSTEAIGDLSEIRKFIGEFDWASLYGQQPRPRGGKLFGPAHVYERAGFNIAGHRLFIGADPAASTKTSADYSAAVVLAIKGYGVHMTAKILEVVRQQSTVPAFAARLLALQRDYPTSRVAIESVGGFKAVAQMIRQLEPRLDVKEINPRGDKFTRAQLVAAAWNDGRVEVPTSAPWLADFLDEIGSFTGVGDAHDDQVDALAHSWNTGAYTRPPSTLVAPKLVELH